MKRNYHTVDQQGKVNERKLGEFLARNGQMLLPMVQLVEQARLAVDEVIDVVGRKTIEAVLWLSARQVAGTPQQGRKREGAIFWHGTQQGSVYLKERKLGVRKPRLRKKQAGKEAEVEIPAYQAMQNRAGLGARMLDIVLNGVSTRSYAGVIPAMAETVGISKSSVSRETIAASEAELKQLLDRRLEALDLLIIYIDGVWFGEQCVIAAVGVDSQGKKHVLGLQEGATENGAAAKSLLEDLVARGLDAGRRRLFVIDGSKALRMAINAVFGAQGLVQRCRNHKLR
ncbi:MAG: transposase, partial [Terriglobia bacterium]